MAGTKQRDNEGLGLIVAPGSLFEGDGGLLTHGGDDRDQELLAFIETIGDTLSDVPLRDLDVVLGDTVVVHEVEETIIDVDLEFKVNCYLRV